MALRVNHYLNNQPRAVRSGVTSGTRPLGTAAEECVTRGYGQSLPWPDRSIGDRNTIPGTISFGGKLATVSLTGADHFRGNVRARIHIRRAETVAAGMPHRETVPEITGGESAGTIRISAGNTAGRPVPVVTLSTNNDRTATGRRATQRSRQTCTAGHRSGPMPHICPAVPPRVAGPCLRVVVRTAATTIGMPIAVECIQPSAARVRIGEPAHSPGRIHQPCWK
jgi:hypothetical protein